MTRRVNPTAQDFLVRLRKLDKYQIKARDVILIYFIAGEPGVNGRELALRLGYPSRSSVQDGIDRMIAYGYIEDRRVAPYNSKTPNDLHILPAGEAMISDVVPT